MVWLLKNWKWILVAAACACLLGFWRLDRAAQYRKGEAAATAHISAALAEVHGKQAVAVLEQERQAAAALSAEQAKIEKERQHAKTVIAGLRGELGRLSKKYYLVFSKSLDFGMILNKNDSGKIFVITVLPKGKKQPKTDTELMMVEGIKIFEYFEIE